VGFCCSIASEAADHPHCDPCRGFKGQLLDGSRVEVEVFGDSVKALLKRVVGISWASQIRVCDSAELGARQLPRAVADLASDLLQDPDRVEPRGFWVDKPEADLVKCLQLAIEDPPFEFHDVLSVREAVKLLDQLLDVRCGDPAAWVRCAI